MSRQLLLLTISFLLMVPNLLGQMSLRLDRLEIEGLKRYSSEQIIEASGLKIGQIVNETLLDEAANRVVQTGFFTNVSFRLRATGDKAIVTFQVEEKAEKGLQVVFENFVWFTDDELASAIRREIPSYDGTALETGTMTGQIKSVLQRVLMDKKIPGQVEHMPSADLTGEVVAHIYSIKGVRIPICEVAFRGAVAITESELLANSKPIIDEDYSRGIVVGFANASLGEIYRERGYLRAMFRNAPVKVLDGPDCKSGVAVTLVVEEGSQYSWEKAEWIDNKALSAPELDNAMAMKTGEVANIKKINKGLNHAGKAFGTKGYIAATLRPVREFDDASKRVTFRIRVLEGAQYRMGSLTIIGLPDQIATPLKSKWKLAAGDVFDSSYVSEFIEFVLARDPSFQSAMAGRSRTIENSSKPDRQNLTVNVTITIK